MSSRISLVVALLAVWLSACVVEEPQGAAGSRADDDAVAVTTAALRLGLGSVDAWCGLLSSPR